MVAAAQSLSVSVPARLPVELEGVEPVGGLEDTAAHDDDVRAFVAHDFLWGGVLLAQSITWERGRKRSEEDEPQQAFPVPQLHHVVKRSHGTTSDKVPNLTGYKFNEYIKTLTPNEIIKDAKVRTWLTGRIDFLNNILFISLLVIFPTAGLLVCCIYIFRFFSSCFQIIFKVCSDIQWMLT